MITLVRVKLINWNWTSLVNTYSPLNSRKTGSKVFRDSSLWEPIRRVDYHSTIAPRGKKINPVVSLNPFRKYKSGPREPIIL